LEAEFDFEQGIAMVDAVRCLKPDSGWATLGFVVVLRIHLITAKDI
jgi:hypothetical protein